MAFLSFCSRRPWWSRVPGGLDIYHKNLPHRPDSTECQKCLVSGDVECAKNSEQGHLFKTKTKGSSDNITGSEVVKCVLGWSASPSDQAPLVVHADRVSAVARHRTWTTSDRHLCHPRHSVFPVRRSRRLGLSDDAAYSTATMTMTTTSSNRPTTAAHNSYIVLGSRDVQRLYVLLILFGLSSSYFRTLESSLLHRVRSPATLYTSSWVSMTFSACKTFSRASSQVLFGLPLFPFALCSPVFCQPSLSGGEYSVPCVQLRALGNKSSLSLSL